MKICLCGSTKFKEAFELWQIRLTLAGHVVHSIACASQSDGKLNFTQEEKKILDRVHFQKILESEAIVVLNVGGYIGESTQNEINWAKQTGRTAYWLELKGVTDVIHKFSVYELQRISPYPEGFDWQPMPIGHELKVADHVEGG